MNILHGNPAVAFRRLIMDRKPTVGGAVHYRASPGGPQLKSVVKKVWNDTLVDLTVTNADGSTAVVTSVHLADPAAPSSSPSWDWSPSPASATSPSTEPATLPGVGSEVRYCPVAGGPVLKAVVTKVHPGLRVDLAVTMPNVHFNADGGSTGPSPSWRW